MIKRLIIGAAAVGLGAVALGACGEPTGSVSPNGQTYVAHFTRDFQLDVGRPIVWASAICNGSSSWIGGPRYGFNTASPATMDVAVYCASGILQGTPSDSHS